ncbi:hypothetical protein EMGBS4_00250 [Acidimicrobiaceae bacterium]|nr:hypothetical protein EMGBS4_00250 [Acidimicrobiaceae bacterium]
MDDVERFNKVTNTQTSDLFSLNGKVVLVTGGAGLLGQVFCQAFADSGAQVAVVDIDKTGLNQQPMLSPKSLVKKFLVSVAI